MLVLPAQFILYLPKLRMKLLLVNIVIVTMICPDVTGAPLDLTLVPIGLIESFHSVLFDSNILTTHPANQDPSLNIVTWILYKEFQPEIYDPSKPTRKFLGIF